MPTAGGIPGEMGLCSLHPPSKSDDADSGPRGPCVVAATNKFTQTTEVLWRKRGGVATL